MREELLNILAEVCEEEEVKTDLDLELVESGLLDSLAFAELLARLEDELGIVIAPSEIQRTDMDTPAKILALAESRKQG
ncbi:MAG TPA: D-alanine--poly(phosphoribitol) ligase subunit DltC [Candidatus Pullilachnospira intestinigallinarum]|nr:D-alanine--poly(phosphoribitol) ligase subunit DltC [Candidatus Pullilachnospira intestinigallinarum]